MEGYESIINNMDISKSAGINHIGKKKGHVLVTALDTARIMCKRIRTQFRQSKRCTVKKLSCKIAARAHLHHRDKYKVRAIYV